MGFRFATIFLNDAQTGEYRSRIALGEDAARRRTGLIFTLGKQRDLFRLSMESDADLMISDASDITISECFRLGTVNFFTTLAALLCSYDRAKKSPWIFYADPSEAAPKGVPSAETVLI